MSDKTLLTSPLMERAWRIAAVAHADQRRKATDIPYLVHPAAVALILQRSGFGEEPILAAAVLHDVVEDTDWSLDRLRDQFPEDVLHIVEVLTERKHDKSGVKRPWGERKAEQLRRISESSIECRAVWLADKRHNLETIAFDLADGIDVFDRFNADRAAVIQNYRAAVEAARHGDPRLERLGDECLQIVERLESDDGQSGPID
jgi:guanosine-3',5'-bis(diphosphate) 3'-pyrophosphohydrolase